ncbi:hypothetical protein AWC38_SpisGene8044 [Stylophora pistillata]|uniref:FP protein C-terminal domain-containing protein n=1 Tax=Stylophora pistillata TaxID=50429 RepID=A0A2B4SEN5_STYPI|nr:hypothetical protein AWC38_SpisGene8044 [Stylophora pistillata]
MPGSVAALKKENNILKAQLSSMSDEVARLKELIQRHSERSEEVLPSEEGAQCVEFLSKKYDDFHLFSGMAKDELQRLSTKLEELKAKVDIIGNAIDEIQEHSFQYNVKIVGVPERLQDESAASISKLCLNIFKETGADLSMYDIDTAHRVPSRNNNGKPKPIVCRFVRRLAKESVMNHRKDACKLDPASVGLPEDASLSAVRIFDHLSPRMQTVLFEAKKFKEQHYYQYCWSKGSFVYLRKDATSRAHDIKNRCAPLNISELFTHSEQTSSRVLDSLQFLNLIRCKLLSGADQKKFSFGIIHEQPVLRHPLPDVWNAMFDRSNCISLARVRHGTKRDV